MRVVLRTTVAPFSRRRSPGLDLLLPSPSLFLWVTFGLVRRVPVRSVVGVESFLRRIHVRRVGLSVLLHVNASLRCVSALLPTAILPLRGILCRWVLFVASPVLLVVIGWAGRIASWWSWAVSRWRVFVGVCVFVMLLLVFYVCFLSSSFCRWLFLVSCVWVVVFSGLVHLCLFLLDVRSGFNKTVD